MGFSYRKLNETQCIFEARPDGDDGADFLTCVQNALKNVVLDVLVDVSAKPAALGAVLPHLLKLQKVISNHQGSLKIRGMDPQSSPDFVGRLTGMGILVEGLPSLNDSPPITPSTQIPVAHSVIRTLEGEVPKDVLPPSSQVVARFKELRDRLATAIQRKKYLEVEKQGYSERLTYLMKGQNIEGISTEQLQKIADLEAGLALLKEKHNQAQKNLNEMEGRKATAEESQKKNLLSLQDDHKKMKVTLEKKLSDLTKEKEKLTADLKKKTEQMKAKSSGAAG